MRKWLWAALAALFVASGARAQGGQITQDVLRPTSIIAGASVKFCTEGSGCPALANVYTDRALTNLDADSIIVADARGSFTGYVVPGCYNLQISAAGFTTVTKTVCAPVIDSSPGLTMRGNIVPDTADTRTLGNSTNRFDATLDDVVAGKLNSILFVDGVKYATIAAALTAASDGDIIFLPRGNYSVALDTLSVSKAVRFIGAGVNSTVITFTGASGVAFKFIYDDNAPTGSYTDWGGGIENCQIIGPGTINGGAGNAGTGIQLGDATHSSIGAYFRNVVIAGFAFGTTWSQGGPQAIASWGTKFDHVTWLNNDKQVVYDYSGTGTGIAHIEFVHPNFNHFQSGVTMQANAVELGGSNGGDFNLINPYFQSDQLVVSNNRVKLINPTFENTNGQSTTTYISHTGGNLEMINPHFLQTGAGSTVPTAYVTSSAGHLGMVNPGGNNSSATTFPVIALSGSVNVDIYGFRGFSNASALFSGSTSGYINAPNSSTGQAQFNGNDLVDVNSTQTLQGKTFSDTVNLKRVKASQGTALVAGDFALSAGWGTTASVGTITGSDQGFQFTVTSSGTGQAANPTITVTDKDGTWTNAPIVLVKRSGGNQLSVADTWTVTATALTITFNGTPVAAETFTYVVMKMGR